MARQHRDLNRERMWRKHIDSQRSSGQTVRAYCLSHQLRETGFFFWRQEIASRDRESAAAARSTPAFVPVAVIESPAGHTDAPIEIRLAGGHRVRIRAGCDRHLFADVLALLSRSGSEDRPC